MEINKVSKLISGDGHQSYKNLYIYDDLKEGNIVPIMHLLEK